MAFRFHLLLYCSAGSVISVLLALLVMLKLDSALLALLPTIVVPPLFCAIAGLRRLRGLFGIAALATAGWFAGAVSTPVTVLGPERQIERNARLPLAGRDPIVHCAGLGALFAIVGAGVVRLPTVTRGDCADEEADSATEGD